MGLVFNIWKMGFPKGRRAISVGENIILLVLEIQRVYVVRWKNVDGLEGRGRWRIKVNEFYLEGRRETVLLRQGCGELGWRRRPWRELRLCNIFLFFIASIGTGH